MNVDFERSIMFETVFFTSRAKHQVVVTLSLLEVDIGADRGENIFLRI
jgi:hypothetical protein